MTKTLMQRALKVVDREAKSVVVTQRVSYLSVLASVAVATIVHIAGRERAAEVVEGIRHTLGAAIN